MLLALTSPLRWGTPARAARLLMAFARAERSSYYDMLAAAQASPDPARRALYLRHATDEARHALMFTLRAREIAPGEGSEHADFEHLYERLGEKRFIAFVHHGEKRGRARLTYFRNEVKDHKTRAMLDAILEDEARHEAYTAELLTALDAWPEVKRARLWELGRGWLRTGSVVTVALFGLCMRLLYLLAFPIALGVKWRRS